MRTLRQLRRRQRTIPHPRLENGYHCGLQLPRARPRGLLWWRNRSSSLSALFQRGPHVRVFVLYMLCIDQSDVSAQQFQGTARRFRSGGAAAAAAVDLRHRRLVSPSSTGGLWRPGTSDSALDISDWESVYASMPEACNFRDPSLSMQMLDSSHVPAGVEPSPGVCDCASSACVPMQFIDRTTLRYH
jgi:hypothetical protein